MKNNREKENNLYTNKSESELVEIERQLRESGEVVVSFSNEEWENAVKVISGEMKEFQPDATRKYVATKLLKELEGKYPRLREEYHGSTYLPVFKAGSHAAYEKKCDLIYNVFDVRDILEVEEIPVKKVSIFTHEIESPILGTALLELLSDDFPFDVDIYANYSKTMKQPEKKTPTK